MNRDRSDTGLSEHKSGVVIDIEELDTSIDISSRNRSSENIEGLRFKSFNGNTP
jgi:hypothetical protein